MNWKRCILPSCNQSELWILMPCIIILATPSTITTPLTMNRITHLRRIDTTNIYWSKMNLKVLPRHPEYTIFWLFKNVENGREKSHLVSVNFSSMVWANGLLDQKEIQMSWSIRLIHNRGKKNKWRITCGTCFSLCFILSVHSVDESDQGPFHSTSLAHGFRIWTSLWPSTSLTWNCMTVVSDH